MVRVNRQHSAAPSHDPDRQRLELIRHSLAHVLAQAVQELRPGSKLGFGPPIADGFYYDFILSAPLTERDFPELEARMRAILQSGQSFEHEELPREQALERLAAMGEPYKREYAGELLEQRGLGCLSFYRSGPFVDMCDGPHVKSTREIPEDAFRLRSVAGAYFRGDEHNVMMTRIYAWAFLSREELEMRVAEHELGLSRDHKKLGRELDIFAFDDEIGRGLPLWLPNGTVIREELERLMKELEFQAGFQRVATPPLAKRELYFRTGHLPYYAEHMFPFMEVRSEEPSSASSSDEVYCLRPMNCPHHHKVFAARKRSYRELPLRLAEYGQTYRYEDSGAVSGLLRVRAMNMNDGHIYCTEAQIVSECLSILDMHRTVYDVLGLKNWRVRLSRRGEGAGAQHKFVDDPAGWERAERLLAEVLRQSGLDYEDGLGEAAFYGPKIDFQFRMVTGREETASTLQLDFAMAGRLGLHYTASDGSEQRPFILHRAPLGTHERFVALLLEHFGGAFPTWLAPVQVRVLPVAAAHHEYAAELVRELRRCGVRADSDDLGDGVAKKIRAASLRKIPNLLVVGGREQRDRTVTLRRHGSSEQETLPANVFIERLLGQIARRSDADRADSGAARGAPGSGVLNRAAAVRS